VNATFPPSEKRRWFRFSGAVLDTIGSKIDDLPASYIEVSKMLAAPYAPAAPGPTQPKRKGSTETTCRIESRTEVTRSWWLCFFVVLQDARSSEHGECPAYGLTQKLNPKRTPVFS